jgi:hypothetical protein
MRTLSLDLAIAHEWERIDLVREAVGRCVMAVFADEELKDALSMVCAELLENAMKYGSAGADVTLAIRDDGEALTVTVTNAIDDQSLHVGELRSRIDWLRGCANPADAYTQALAKIYAKGNVDESGLGIVRIAYEGGCLVECDTSDPRKVVVHARRPRPAGAPA